MPHRAQAFSTKVVLPTPCRPTSSRFRCSGVHGGGSGAVLALVSWLGRAAPRETVPASSELGAAPATSRGLRRSAWMPVHCDFMEV